MLATVKEKMTPRPIDPRTAIGHVHLKVADLERALGFYRDVLGFEVTQTHGQQAAFLSAGGYHHHIGLNTWESAGGSPHRRARRGCITRNFISDAGGAGGCVAARAGSGHELDGGRRSRRKRGDLSARSDDNGVELYWDRRASNGRVAADGGLNMFTRALDLDALLKEQ